MRSQVLRNDDANLYQFAKEADALVFLRSRVGQRMPGQMEEMINFTGGQTNLKGSGVSSLDCRSFWRARDYRSCMASR